MDQNRVVPLSFNATKGNRYAHIASATVAAELYLNPCSGKKQPTYVTDLKTNPPAFP